MLQFSETIRGNCVRLALGVGSEPFQVTLIEWRLQQGTYSEWC